MRLNSIVAGVGLRDDDRQHLSLRPGEWRGLLHGRDVEVHRRCQRLRVQAHELDDVPHASGSTDGRIVLFLQVILSVFNGNRLDPGHELSSFCCDRPRSSGDKASLSFDFEVAAARGSVVQLQTGPWESLKLTLTCVTDSASEGHDHHALDSFFHCCHSHAVFLPGNAQLLDTSSRWWSQILAHGPIRNSAAGLVGAE